ncbi:T9SS type A sorting domain-containing protein [Maribacter sp. 2308TA10-17]|uniref:T9SS type A sorting domain-containing protein n=1 Tax=Maribacter sp. 2308TA10-17 TaxID=3386276 RepID=UPI0039BC7EBE
MMKNLVFLILALLSISATAQSSEVQNTEAPKATVIKQKIKVFPNPATNVVNILGLKNSKHANITISDISGNAVLQRQWAVRNNSVSIPIPNLNAGIYVVRIVSEEQKIQVKFYKN